MARVIVQEAAEIIGNRFDLILIGFIRPEIYHFCIIQIISFLRHTLETLFFAN